MRLDNLQPLGHTVWQGFRALFAAIGEIALRETADRLGLPRQVLQLLVGALIVSAACRLWRRRTGARCQFCSC